MPFQCSSSVRSLPVLSKNVPPADHTSAVAAMSTPLRKLPPVGPPGLGLGLGTRVQEVPFQCSRSVPSPPPFVWKKPLAQASDPVRELTPVSWPPPLRKPGVGLGTWVHALPSQCSTSVTSAPWLLSPNPTAQP